MTILKNVQLQLIKGGDPGTETDEYLAGDTVSDVIKTRTDTAKNSIRNIN